MSEPIGIRGLRTESGPLLRAVRLTKTFTSGFGRNARTVHAVNDVSFELFDGETLGLVGESGSGKSTLGRLAVNLIPPTTGQVEFEGASLTSLSSRELRAVRARMQIVFQDPYSSLDSRMTVREIIEEPLIVHAQGTRAMRAAQVKTALELVGIAASGMDRKPHSFSGGQRQRIALARSLVLSPRFMVLDEPVTALDVSVQAQVLNLLMDLREHLNVAYLFIVHDLAIAEQFCDRIAVLYRGEIVELAPSDELFAKPAHPYTAALFAAAPIPDPSRARDRIVLHGEVDDSPQDNPGCPFRARCPIGAARAICAEKKPELVEENPGHWKACHFSNEVRKPF